MKSLGATVPQDRALTLAELVFVQWLLANGNARSKSFLPQVSQAHVTGACSCGCASINLSIDGVSHYGTAGMEILCEYQWRNESGDLFGVFAFACNDLLAGVDLWSIDGGSTPIGLPPTSILEAI